MSGLNQLQMAVAGAALGPADPNFANVVFLFNGDEVNGATAWTDKSPTPKAITMVGSGLSSTTGEANFGLTGLHMPSRSGAWKAGALADWIFLNGGTKFTFETFIRFADFTSINGVLSTSNGSTANIGCYLALNTSRQLEFYIFYGSIGNLVISGTFSNTWPNDAALHFLQINFDPTLGSNHAQCKIDGGTTANISLTGNPPSGANPTSVMTLGMIGAAGGNYMPGGIAAARITSGVVRSFAVPAAIFPDH